MKIQPTSRMTLTEIEQNQGYPQSFGAFVDGFVDKSIAAKRGHQWPSAASEFVGNVLESGLRR
ncbi:hypothetical protein [Thalassovita sp.]|uniref:hypothetical protein n=1 Tax=Thalassovita sp. TaxID=1979401 RepID=UPI0029DE828A|nr:hypothetical protein [Thalassovita sp.]